MADYEDEVEVKIKTKLEDSDFTEEHEEPATCVVQRLLCNQKAYDTTQRHQYSKCSVKRKVCNLLIDNESCENIIFRALFDYLNLERSHTLILTPLVRSRRVPLSK